MNRNPYSHMTSGGHPKREDTYGEFNATELYCPHCRQAMPVRQSLLLVLPDGDKYEYCCRRCGSSVGDKVDRTGGIYRSPGR